MDALHIPDVIRESAPRHATRLDLVSATLRRQGVTYATAVEHSAEAFTAADNLLRALREFQALRTDRPDEMRAWLEVVASGAIDQLGNVQGAIERELDFYGCNVLEPLDLSELEAFHASVNTPRDSDNEESGW
jgi:hypothetical protein